MVVPFTDREMRRAWRENYDVSSNTAGQTRNAHRLLLFYAVECGLKALLMKQKNVSCTDLIPEILSHDLNKLLDYLRAGEGLYLRQQYKICDLKKQNQSSQRNIGASEINQMWRYGGQATETHSDKDIEESLRKTADWIKKQI